MQQKRKNRVHIVIDDCDKRLIENLLKKQVAKNSTDLIIKALNLLAVVKDQLDKKYEFYEKQPDGEMVKLRFLV